MVRKGEMIEWIDRHATAITFAVAILVSVFLVFLGFYEALWLAALPNGSSYGEIIRNYGLIVVAFGLPRLPYGEAESPRGRLPNNATLLPWIGFTKRSRCCNRITLRPNKWVS